ncbi:MAG: cadherin-like domain-containing protein [Myxococcales bacterium]
MQSTELRQFCKTILPASAALLMLGITSPAHAALERVGPANTASSVGGYPAWYQDSTGLSLEFCDPTNASEVAGGWCLLLPGDVPTVPEVFPGTFFDEHFYFAGGSSLTPATGGKALLNVALEGAFAGAGNPAAGQQITFARIRVNLIPVPTTGTYRFIHPYGEEHIAATAGSRIFFTDDVGINCPPGGPYDCALAGRLGPFLLPSDTAGGLETGPVTAANPTPDTNPAHFGGVFTPTTYPGNGKVYIADPARLGPVTGSALPPFTDSTGALRDHNIFRIEGPAGSGIGGAGVDFIETTDFTLQGRVFTATVAGRVTIDRASYTKTASAVKLDVFASGAETQPSRLPGAPLAVAVSPALSFYEAPCGTDLLTGALIAPLGLTDQQMFQDGTYFWSQSVPAVIPTAVCVKDSAARDITGAVVPAFFQHVVTDEITITKASYDGDTAVLTVNATSSDAVTPPALAVDGFGAMTGGVLSYSPLMASPAKITVRSALGATATIDVTTSFFGAAPGALRALNDSFTFAEDSGAQTLDVLANDTSAAGGTIAIVAGARLGTALANLAGSVTYTANANANGIDSFTYRVTTAAGTSNIATVTLNITPVNDPPLAVNDGPFTVVAGAITTLPNLLDNDIDPDGRADMVAAVQIVTPPTVKVAGGANGLVTFTAPSAGTYTFTYKVQDKAAVVSANTATVTVTVIPTDTVTITKATYTLGAKRWVVTGTTSTPLQTINLTYVNGTAAGHSIATVPVDALGNWTLDIRGVTGLDDPSTLAVRPTTLKATSSSGGSSTVTITYK